MRAEARAERPAAAGREGAEPRAEGFARALREAEARGGKRTKGEEGGTATATSNPTPTTAPIPTATPTLTAPLPPDDAPVARSAEVAARALATVAVARENGQPALVVSSGDGVRYEVTGGAAGLELRAVAPPLLERVARADLHGVAGACDRRGLPLRRATVRVESGGRGGGKR